MTSTHHNTNCISLGSLSRGGTTDVVQLRPAVTIIPRGGKHQELGSTKDMTHVTMPVISMAYPAEGRHHSHTTTPSSKQSVKQLPVDIISVTPVKTTKGNGAGVGSGITTTVSPVGRSREEVLQRTSFHKISLSTHKNRRLLSSSNNTSSSQLKPPSQVQSFNSSTVMTKSMMSDERQLEQQYSNKDVTSSLQPTATTTATTTMVSSHNLNHHSPPTNGALPRLVVMAKSPWFEGSEPTSTTSSPSPSPPCRRETVDPPDMATTTVVAPSTGSSPSPRSPNIVSPSSSTSPMQQTLPVTYIGTPSRTVVIQRNATPRVSRQPSSSSVDMAMSPQGRCVVANDTPRSSGSSESLLAQAALSSPAVGSVMRSVLEHADPSDQPAGSDEPSGEQYASRHSLPDVFGMMLADMLKEKPPVAKVWMEKWFHNYAVSHPTPLLCADASSAH